VLGNILYTPQSAHRPMLFVDRLCQVSDGCLAVCSAKILELTYIDRYNRRELLVVMTV